ncbi:unnamed protein product [Malus baccata var. baccata]
MPQSPTYLGTSVYVGPNIFAKLLERYQQYNAEEIAASKNAGGTDKKHNLECSGLRTGASRTLKMIQSDIEAQDLDNLDVPELTKLEEELDAVLRQTRSRKYGKSDRLVVKTHLSAIDNADTADDGNTYSSYRAVPIAICLRAYSRYTCADERSMCTEKQLKEEKLLMENEIAAKEQQIRDRAADEEPVQQNTSAANHTTTATSNNNNNCSSDDDVPATILRLF